MKLLVDMNLSPRWITFLASSGNRRGVPWMMPFIKGENEMTTVTMEIPGDMLSALRRSPDEFIQELRLAAAIQWYAQGWIAQSKAAEFASVSRAEFLDELYRRQIPAVQVTEKELLEEVFGG